MTDARDEQREYLKALLANGLTWAQISKRMGMAISTLAGWAKEMGLTHPRTAASSAWPPADVETLKSMWIDGHSASQIADALGNVSRNAVIGKVHRLGLMRSERTARKAPASPKRIKEAKPASAPKRKKRGAGPMGSLEGHRPNVIKGVQGAQPSQKVVPIESSIKARLRAAEIANAAARRVPIMELERGQCRWPVNDAARGKEHLFCGAPAIPGKSYCAAHAAIAYRPGGEARASKADDRTQAERVLDRAEAVRRRKGVGA